MEKINRTNRSLTLGYDFDYSNTTLCHVYAFIYKYGEWKFADTLEKVKNKKQFIIKQIKQGLIKYYDLDE